MKTMAEVLAEHQLVHGDWSCTCEEMFYDSRLNGAELGVEHRLHVEERLSAAGFGLVKEAQAGALRDAADEADAIIAAGEWRPVSPGTHAAHSAISLRARAASIEEQA
jgi:hypothetical protein